MHTAPSVHMSLSVDNNVYNFCSKYIQPCSKFERQSLCPWSIAEKLQLHMSDYFICEASLVNCKFIQIAVVTIVRLSSILTCTYLQAWCGPDHVH